MTTMLHIFQKLKYLLPRKVSLKHLIKNITSHDSMMIVKLQSDHARPLYASSIEYMYSLVLKI